MMGYRGAFGRAGDRIIGSGTISGRIKECRIGIRLPKSCTLGRKSPAEAGLESGQVKCGALREVLTRLAGGRITLSPKNSQLPGPTC